VSDVKFPDVEVGLIGEDGNVFNVIGKVKKALRAAGYREGAEEFTREAFACGSYDEVLQLVMNTVEIA
jgi:hypothetical protein